MKRKYFELLASCIVFSCLFGCMADVDSDSSVSSKKTIKRENKKINQTQKNTTTGNAQVMDTATEFSPDAVLEKVAASKRPFATGWSPSTDIWMISRQKIRLKDGMSNQEALNIAEIKAKKKIAEFRGSSISAKDEAYLSVDNTDGKRKFKQSFSSATYTNVNQFLRGVTLLKAEKKGNVIIASFYVTGKMVDATKELEKQLRKAPPGTVRTSGYAIIVDNRISPAKQAALQIALRNAVEQVMGTTVVGQSSLMNNAKAKSKIISQTVGKIKKYRIVKEGVTGINYQVIAVSEIDKDSLVDNYAALVRSMGNPAFFVRTEDPDLRIALSDFMKELGFQVSVNSTKANFIIDARCTYLNVQDEQYGQGIQIDLQLRLLNKKTGELYLSMQNTPRLTSTYSGTFHQIRQSAARKAFKEIRKPYHAKLNKVVLDWVLNGHDIQIVFNNFNGNAPSAMKLERAISNIPGVKILDKRQNDSRLTFKCTCIGPTSDVEDFLQEAILAEFGEDVAIPKTQKIDLDEIQLHCQ